MTAVPEKSVLFGCQGEQLIGILHPVGPAESCYGVLIVVGGPQYRVGSHRQFVHLARSLAESEFPVFRFDCRGMGDSSGTFPGFERIDADIHAGIDAFFREFPSLGSVIVFGLCDSASAALLYCCSDARVSGLILANPWVRTAEGQARSFLRHYYGRRLVQRSFWRKLLMGQLNIYGALNDFLRNLASSAAGGGPRMERVARGTFIDRMLRGLEAFRGSVLILLSERDLTAQEFRDLSRSSARWRSAIQKPMVTVEICLAADHTFSSAVACAQMTSTVLAWLRKRVSSESEPTSQRLRADVGRA